MCMCVCVIRLFHVRALHVHAGAVVRVLPAVVFVVVCCLLIVGNMHRILGVLSVAVAIVKKSRISYLGLLPHASIPVPRASLACACSHAHAHYARPLSLHAYAPYGPYGPYGPYAPYARHAR